jgi:hypothetical protein
MALVHGARAERPGAARAAIRAPPSDVGAGADGGSPQSMCGSPAAALLVRARAASEAL